MSTVIWCIDVLKCSWPYILGLSLVFITEPPVMPALKSRSLPCPLVLESWCPARQKLSSDCGVHSPPLIPSCPRLPLWVDLLNIRVHQLQSSPVPEHLWWTRQHAKHFACLLSTPHNSHDSHLVRTSAQKNLKLSSLPVFTQPVSSCSWPLLCPRDRPH